MILSQSKFDQPYGTETDYKRLYYLNIQYIQSWVRSDTATYNTLLWADDFVHQSGSTGALFPKKEIAKIFGEPRFESIDYFYADEVIIRFFDHDAAMVFARPPYKEIDSHTEDLSRYNDIYVRRDGHWRCVSANITLIRNPLEVAAIHFDRLPPQLDLMSWHQASTQEREEVNAKHTAYLMALKRSDFGILKSILADDLVLLDAGGDLLSKNEMLHSISNLQKYQLEKKLQIRFVRKDIAMVHYAFITTQTPSSGIQCNDVYIKRGDKWQCVSINHTPIKN